MNTWNLKKQIKCTNYKKILEPSEIKIDKVVGAIIDNPEDLIAIMKDIKIINKDRIDMNLVIDTNRIIDRIEIIILTNKKIIIPKDNMVTLDRQETNLDFKIDIRTIISPLFLINN